MVKLAQLQVLRAIAALMVVVSHAVHEAGGIWGVSAVPGWLARFPGNAGVDIFFVLSGFIMAYAARADFGNPRAILPFLARRLARIAPLYWVLTTAMLAILLLAPSVIAFPPDHWTDIVASYAFFPLVREADGLFRPLLALGWTLNYEMFFYGVFAFSLVLPIRFALPVVIAVLACLAGVGLVFELPGAAGFWTSAIILEFAFGIALAAVYLAGVRFSVVVSGFVGVVAVGLLAIAPEFDAELSDWRVVHYGIPALLLVGALALLDRERLHMPRVPVAMGDASYSTYLSHPFTLGVIAVACGRIEVDAFLSPTVFILLCVIASALAGQVVYWIVEKPLSDGARVMLTGRKPPKPDAPLHPSRLTAVTSPSGARRAFRRRTA